MSKVPIYVLTLWNLSAIPAHSMEEAEALCDRVGIFVNGELQCIGNAKEVIHLVSFNNNLNAVRCGMS